MKYTIIFYNEMEDYHSYILISTPEEIIPITSHQACFESQSEGRLHGSAILIIIQVLDVHDNLGRNGVMAISYSVIK